MPKHLQRTNLSGDGSQKLTAVGFTLAQGPARTHVVKHGPWVRDSHQPNSLSALYKGMGLRIVSKGFIKKPPEPAPGRYWAGAARRPCGNICKGILIDMGVLHVSIAGLVARL